MWLGESARARSNRLMIEAGMLSTVGDTMWAVGSAASTCRSGSALAVLGGSAAIWTGGVAAGGGGGAGAAGGLTFAAGLSLLAGGVSSLSGVLLWRCRRLLRPVWGAVVGGPGEFGAHAARGAGGCRR